MPQALAQPMHTDPSVIPWGLLEYSGALERQLEVWATRVRGECRDILAVVEHPPVITLGRHAPAADALLDHPALRDKRIPVVRTDRGGRATYHGPGQACMSRLTLLIRASQ